MASLSNRLSTKLSLTAALRSLSVAAALMAGSLAGAPAFAQSGTCNGFVSISYPVSATPNFPGSTGRVRLTLQAGDIQGGTFLSVNQVAFYLDCRNKGCTPNFLTDCNTNADCGAGKTCFALGTTCIDDGDIMNYIGNITTTCPTTWTAGTPNSVNQIVFSAAPAVSLPANGTSCAIEFDIKTVASMSNDSTPGMVEQVAGFMNANCNNGTSSSASQSGFLSVGALPPTEMGAPAASALGLAALCSVLLGLAFRKISAG